MADMFVLPALFAGRVKVLGSYPLMCPLCPVPFFIDAVFNLFIYLFILRVKKMQCPSRTNFFLWGGPRFQIFILNYVYFVLFCFFSRHLQDKFKRDRSCPFVTPASNLFTTMLQITDHKSQLAITSLLTTKKLVSKSALVQNNISLSILFQCVYSFHDKQDFLLNR